MAPSVSHYIASEVPSQPVERQVEHRLGPPTVTPASLQPAVDHLLGRFKKLDSLDRLPELMEPLQELNQLTGLRDMIEAQLKPLSKMPLILALLQTQKQSIESLQADLTELKKPRPSVWARIKGIFRAPHCS